MDKKCKGCRFNVIMHASPLVAGAVIRSCVLRRTPDSCSELKSFVEAAIDEENRTPDVLYVGGSKVIFVGDDGEKCQRAKELLEKESISFTEENDVLNQQLPYVLCGNSIWMGLEGIDTFIDWWK